MSLKRAFYNLRRRANKTRNAREIATAVNYDGNPVLPAEFEHFAKLARALVERWDIAVIESRVNRGERYGSSYGSHSLVRASVGELDDVTIFEDFVGVDGLGGSEEAILNLRLRRQAYDYAVEAAEVLGENPGGLLVYVNGKPLDVARTIRSELCSEVDKFGRDYKELRENNPDWIVL